MEEFSDLFWIFLILLSAVISLAAIASYFIIT